MGSYQHATGADMLPHSRGSYMVAVGGGELECSS